jgi:hypothetical protein
MSRWTLVRIDDLPEPVKFDIVCWLAERHPAFEDDRSLGFVKDNLLRLADPPLVAVGLLEVAILHEGFARAVSEKAVQRYEEMLRLETFEFDPILVAGGRFLDGGHRLEAYARAGRRTIPVVEVGHITGATTEFWRRWLDGEDVRFEPSVPGAGHTEPEETRLPGHHRPDGMQHGRRER